jgi:phosphatidate cytidylyltransferase
MLGVRILSAIVAAAVIVPVVLWGGTIGVTVLVLICSSIGVWELSRNLPAIKTSPGKELTVTMAAVVVMAFAVLPAGSVPAIVVWFPLAVLLLHLFLYNVIDNTVDSTAQMIFVAAYVAIPLGHAVLLERLSQGAIWVLFVLVVICLGDAGAYFVGKFYGKHHFSVKISPGKTVEGLSGCVAGSFAGMIIMKILCPSLPSLCVLSQLTLVLAVLGPLGDLCASAIKRRLSIKDFGAVMPGHGGILDRADSLIPAFPATYYFLILSLNAVP